LILILILIFQHIKRFCTINSIVDFFINDWRCVWILFHTIGALHWKKKLLVAFSVFWHVSLMDSQTHRDYLPCPLVRVCRLEEVNPLVKCDGLLGFVALGVALGSMTRSCSLEPTQLTLVIDASGWPFTTVSLTEHDKDNHVGDLEKFICTTITPETGGYMQFVLVWNPRWACCYHLWIFLKFSLRFKCRARSERVIAFLKIILQIYSQCNVYEAGTKKKTFEFYTEKVKYFFSLKFVALLSLCIS